MLSLFGDADAETYVKEGMDTLFPGWEQIKRDKYERHCHEKWKHFSPFILSVDGMMGKEAQVILVSFS